MKPSENINGEIIEVIDSLTAVISDVSNIKAVIPENKGLKGVISNNDEIIASVETEVIDINASVINETEELQGSIGIPYLVKGNNDRVSAENVFFNEDITLAGDYTQVGNITKDRNETKILPAKNKSLKDIMINIFTKELQPTKIDPSVSISLNQSGGKEVGTIVMPTYTATFNSGSYTYNTNTGVELLNWKIEDSFGSTSNVNSGSFNGFIVDDSTNYTITATATYSEGEIALTNLNNESNPIIKILAGSKSKKSSSITGYRCIFYGVIDDTISFDSNKVRGMTNGGSASSKTINVSVNGDINAKRICVAIPKSSNLSIKNVMKTDGLETDITSTYYIEDTVNVDGKNNCNLMTEYDIWTYKPAKIDSAEVHKITIG